MDAIGRLTSHRLEQYCRCNDYRFVVHTDAAFDRQRPAAWSKIRMLQNAIHEALADYVLWVDADAVVLRNDFRLESVLRPEKRMFISSDLNGLNSGVWMVRADAAMDEFLETVYDQTQFLLHPWREQAALMHLVSINHADVASWIEHVPQRLWNSYLHGLYQRPTDDGEMNAESFILHVPALPLDQRLAVLKTYV